MEPKEKCQKCDKTKSHKLSYFCVVTTTQFCIGGRDENYVCYKYSSFTWRVVGGLCLFHNVFPCPCIIVGCVCVCVIVCCWRSDITMFGFVMNRECTKLKRNQKESLKSKFSLRERANEWTDERNEITNKYQPNKILEERTFKLFPQSPQ